MMFYYVLAAFAIFGALVGALVVIYLMGSTIWGAIQTWLRWTS